MNVKLLRRIQKALLQEPRRYDQDHYVYDVRGRPDAPACGTVACLAGHAVALSRGYKSFRSLLRLPGDESVRSFRVAVAATDALGLTPDEAIRLFASPADWCGWPEDLVEAYRSATTPEERARVGVERIERFIASKRRE